MEVLGMLFLAGALTLYSSFSWGVALFYVYKWFAMPVFEHLPPITVAESMGLMFVISLFKNHPFPRTFSYKGENVKETIDYLFGVFMPWIFLLMAWFVKLFI